jgi:GWxTD domain-containing protein
MAFMTRPRFSKIVVFWASLAGLSFACSQSARTPAPEQIERFLAAGDTSSAIRHIERVNLRRQGDPSMYVLLGRLYRETRTINGRLQSQKLLERALQSYPGDPDVLTELGKTYFAQTFYRDAVRCFQSALAVDPSRCEAHHYIGLYNYNNWKRVNEFTDNLLASRRHFAAAVECDSTDFESSYRLAYALYALKRKADAAKFSVAAARRFPDAPEFYMLRGALAYDAGEYKEAADYFREGLARMDDDLRKEYVDLFDLLTYQERFLYEDSHENKRDIVERSYWIDLDPDPTTAINERHLEHVYRMFVADIFFSYNPRGIRGWNTERGAAVVKFGWPWQVERTLGDSWDSGRIEKWYYIQRGMMRQFVFEDEYLSGNLRIPIYADSMVVVLRYDPRMSSYHTETVEIPGAMDVTAFKDDEFSSTLYVAARVDADSVDTVIDVGKIESFYFRGAFFDRDWKSDRRFADTLATSDVRSASDGNKTYYFLVRDVDLPFDSYHVACAFEDDEGLTRALLKGHGDSYRFSEGRLIVSDVLYQDEARRDMCSFVRKGKRLYPNPGRVYAQGQRLVVYFELYGLQMSARSTDYDITYAIYEAPEPSSSTWRQLGRRIAGFVGAGDDRNPAISQTIHRQGVDYTGTEDMRVNIDTLTPGRYELIVTVADHVSGEWATSASFFFKSDVGK